MSTIIEIDGIRHRLVEDEDKGSNCSDCSLESVCPKTKGIHLAVNALCVILDDYDHHFEIEK